MTFAMYLRTLMDRRGLSKQKALGGAIGVSTSQVSRWLNDANPPEAAQCVRIAQFFGVPEEEVLRAAGRMSGAFEVPERPDIHPDMAEVLGELDWEVQGQLAAVLRGAAISLQPMLGEERRAERRAATKSRRFSEGRAEVPAGEGQ